MMRPSAVARELVFPLTDMGVVLAIIVFTVLATLASSAWLFGIWLMAVILPAFFRYLLYLLEARANDRDAPVPGIELFNWVENFWSLFPLVLLATLVWGAYFLATNVSVIAAIVFAVAVLLLLPASMAVLATTRSPLQSLNPLPMVQIMRACDLDYLLIVLQFMLATAALYGLQSLDVPSIVTNFAILYQAVLLFTFTGAVLRVNKVVAQIDIPDALEPGEQELADIRDRERRSVANHAYGFVSRGNRAGGLEHIHKRIAREADADDARRWFFNEMLTWESKDAALVFAQTWLNLMLSQQRNVEALKLTARCLLENPEFRPLAEDREAILELAREAKHDELLRQLR